MTRQDLIFIGDIHGQNGKLRALLEHLDFIADPLQERRHLVFIGDLIDNGPELGIDHQGVLTLVKDLCDQGLACCLMGNHEFNAVGWALKHPNTGLPLRHNSDNNRKQHQRFLQDMDEGSDLHKFWIDWFMKLPLFYDFGHVRAIHACWHELAIQRILPYLNEDNSLKVEHWPNAFDERHELYQLCEILLKGPELALPQGYSFWDKTGTERHRVRVKWWSEEAITYRDIAQVQPNMVNGIPSIPLADEHCNPIIEIPVVIGHYTLAGLPAPLSGKVLCVDYNAASPRGELVAYSWCHDETSHQLHERNFNYLSDMEFGQKGLAAMRVLFDQLADRYTPALLKPEKWEEIRQCLLNHWDPAFISGVNECRDEYDDYITPMATLAQQASWEELSCYLMGITKSYFNQELEPDAADRLAKRLQLVMNSELD